MLQNSNAISVDDSYVIERSLRFNSASNQYLNRAVLADFQTTWTWSCWVKRGTLGTRQHLFGINNSNSIRFSNTTLNAFTFEVYNGVGANYYIETTQLFRDTSSWYHFVCVWDTTNATASERQRVYVNGSRVTSFASGNSVPLNAISVFNGTATHEIGRSVEGGFYFDGEIAENIFISGEALDASSFGEFNPITNQWVAKKYSGIFDINSFYLDFKDGTSTATLGYDKSENANNWTLTNFTRSAGVNDCWMLDVPSGNGNTGIQPSSNYAIIDPLFAGANSISKSNLAVTYTSASIAFSQLSNFTVSVGRWYHEANLASFSVGDAANNVQAFGYRSRSTINSRIEYGWRTDGSIMRHCLIYTLNGALVQRINIDTVSPISTDILALTFDVDLGIATSYKNGIQTAQIVGISNVGDWTPSVTRDGTSNAATWNFNFGQRSFAYTPPTGFKALCTANLPIPSIAKPKEHFDILTYTGDGTTNRSFSSMQFSPDLVWIKHRSGSISHGLWNSNVGGGANKGLATDRTVDEASAGFDDTNGYLTTFDSNGFSVKTGVYTNNNTTPYVAWQWRASDLPAVTNNVGTISSQVSVNTTAGFSIVTYTGTGTNSTVGHGLGIAPKMIIVKNRTVGSAGYHWFVYHISTGANDRLLLNTTGATAPDSASWNNTAPTSTVFSIGSAVQVNGSTNSHVAYCFSEIAGYSKFGSYTGNGSADGPFVHCGFRPRYIMIKSSSSATDWEVFDTSRDSFNQMANRLYPNSSSAEAGGSAVDSLSNGFKLRLAGTTNINTNGATYIYMSFAESPFQYSNAR